MADVITDGSQWKRRRRKRRRREGVGTLQWEDLAEGLRLRLVGRDIPVWGGLSTYRPAHTSGGLATIKQNREAPGRATVLTRHSMAQNLSTGLRNNNNNNNNNKWAEHNMTRHQVQFMIYELANKRGKSNACSKRGATQVRVCKEISAIKTNITSI